MAETSLLGLFLYAFVEFFTLLAPICDERPRQAMGMIFGAGGELVPDQFI